MRDRLALATLLILSWIILFIFQKYLPIQSAVYILFGFITFYIFLIETAQSHQRRKIKKLIKQGMYKGKFTNELNYEPFVSIVIPAHNEENVIKDTIKNILQVDYGNFEIIVADDRSTDRTIEIIKTISNEHPEVSYHTREKDSFPGKSAVLNEILPTTKGEVICVFDADARIDPDFLKNILPYLADKETGAVQARKVIINRDTNLLTRCQDNEYILDTHFQAGRDSIKGAVELRGNGQIIKREALDDIGGWNNYTLTDDLDLSTRLHLKGWDVRFAEDVEVYEEGIIRIMPLLRQRRRWIEGSIRRYLDYFNEILFSPNVSLRVSLDMFAYLAEFALPVWLVSEYFIQGIRFVKGVEDNFLYTLSIAPALCFFFVFGLIFSIRKYKEFEIRETLKQSIQTGIYMVLIWVPIVCYIVFKIILMKKNLDWGKTAHGVPISRIQEEIPNSN
ncbi:MAG: hypothetical protein A2Y25_11725 [Candidatus Melainabacteria bacterium GWF2_37_15]|nr:MAG: hypothetical protein A2Y25_11725 [Candidatus Melainabacteria bacterium GWF2_37_15]